MPLTDYRDWPESARGAVVALGNFDGVHRGHQAVIAAARAAAGRRGVPLAAMTFEPHPRAFFQPATEPFRLTSPAAKMRLLRAQGVETVLQQTFDTAFAGLSAEAFAAEVLAGALGTAEVVTGYDFTFGKGRSGTVDALRELGRRHGFTTTTVAPVTFGGEIYSSTGVRQALRDGAAGDAARLLGHWWEIEGPVLHGDRRGRTIGFPTANMALGPYLRPKFGVYAVRATLADQPAPVWIDGVANLGLRPTVGGDHVSLETHLFDFAGDLYDRDLRVALVAFLRPERKFPDFAALTAQIAADAADARQTLAVADNAIGAPAQT